MTIEYTKIIAIFDGTESLGNHGKEFTMAASFSKTDSIEKLFAMAENLGFSPHVSLRIDLSDIKSEPQP